VKTTLCWTGLLLLATSCKAKAEAHADEHGWRPLGPGLASFHETRKDAAGKAVSWTVVRIDLDVVRLRAREVPEQKLETLATSGDVFAVVNGGFFEPGGTPSGLIVNDGRQASAWQERGGSGALVVANHRASVLGAPSLAPPSSDAGTPELAVQCGPRLVEPGGVMGIHADDGKRAERTAACVRRDGREVNLVVAKGAEAGDGPTLFQLATWLTLPLSSSDTNGCDAALNLDGGPSTGVGAHGLPREEWVLPRGPVPWALVVTAR
jgi:uncharacterized protein YigE (DUF2233 family)